MIAKEKSLVVFQLQALEVKPSGCTVPDVIYNKIFQISLNY